MPLYDYQEELVKQVRQSWHSGHKSPCIVLPCGGGKSVIAAEIARRTTDNGKRVLFLVHRIELCQQIENTFKAWNVNMRLCSVMMVQTACRRVERMKPPDLIITDENHHSTANSYKTIYTAFPDAYKVGITATPIRLDGTGLEDINDDLIVGKSTKWLIQNGYLADYDYFSPTVSDLAGIRKVAGDYRPEDVEKALATKKIFGDVIRCYKELSRGMQAICYCATVKHSKKTADEFCAAGINAAHIDGGTPKQERSRIIEDFRQGKIRILCNVSLISEGFDVPDCGCVIMLRPTESLALDIQQAMRCMRYKPGKKAIIIDHVGNYVRHGMPDDEREWSLHGKKNRTEQQYRHCKECYATFKAKDENGKIVKNCPVCGALLETDEQRKHQEMPKASTKVELQSVKGFTIITKTPDECRNYRELMDYAKAHNYKPGWAYYKAKERGLIRGK